MKRDQLAPLPANSGLTRIQQAYREQLQSQGRGDDAERLLLQEEESIWRILMHNSREGIVIIKTDGHVVEANAAFANMLGYSVEEIHTMSVWDWDAYLDHDYIKETLENIDVGGLYEETRHRHKDGTVLDIEMSNNCVYYAGTKLIFCLCRDVSERKKQEKRIHQLVATDALTGAFNRREFDRRLQEASNRFQRYGEHFSVIMFDVDHFKAVNDTHGHAVGDQVLIAIAKCIRSAIRSSDSFGRWGGEEFVLLLPMIDLERAGNVAEKLRILISELEFSAVGAVTASFGVAQSIAGEETEHLVNRADKAMYDAKKSGRNCVKCNKDVSL